MSSKEYQKLSNFIIKQMRMSHIYQPVMLIELLGRKGSASTTEIAKALLGYDISQVEYYEHITKNMVGYTNSERLASDMVYLSCTIKDANGMTDNDDRILPAVKEVQSVTNYARLRKDWIRSRVLLDWVDNHNKYESGLEQTRSMRISVDEYFASDWDIDHSVKRKFNRETLLYRVEYKEYWVERQCVKSTKSAFENRRNQKAAETKAKQNI